MPRPTYSAHVLKLTVHVSSRRRCTNFAEPAPMFAMTSIAEIPQTLSNKSSLSLEPKWLRKGLWGLGVWGVGFRVSPLFLDLDLMDAITPLSTAPFETEHFQLFVWPKPLTPTLGEGGEVRGGGGGGGGRGKGGGGGPKPQISNPDERKTPKPETPKPLNP